MGKEIKVIVKDINKLEFELLEDAKKGDYINLNSINNSIDLSEIKEILEKKKTEYYAPYKENERKQLQDEAVKNFIASKDYQSLKDKIATYEVDNAKLKTQLDGKINEYKQSDEFKRIQSDLQNSHNQIAILNKQLQTHEQEIINKFKASSDYLSLTNELNSYKTTQKYLQENAVTEFKESKEYQAKLEQLKNNEIRINDLNNQLQTSKHDAIEAFKASEEYKNLLKERNELPLLELNLKQKDDELITTKKNFQNEISALNDKHQLELQNQLLSEKDNIIKQYKDSEEYLNLVKEKEELDKEVANLKYSQRIKTTKAIGEELEKWIMNKYQDTFGTAFDDVIFEKANEVIDNTKPDFLFEVFNPTLPVNDPTYITGKVVIEAKTEINDAQFHKKNADHFKKLDADRKKNGGDYAILVTTLEPENDFSIYLAPGYENMFVVRPEWLMSLLSLIRRIFIKEQEIKQLDIEFKDKLELKTMFDDFRTNLLDNAFKNIQANLDIIQTAAQNIITNAEKILDGRNKIVNRHMITMQNKIENFRIEKAIKTLDQIDDYKNKNKVDDKADIKKLETSQIDSHDNTND